LQKDACDYAKVIHEKRKKEKSIERNGQESKRIKQWVF
jgi:hypothetical protein